MKMSFKRFFVQNVGGILIAVTFGMLVGYYNYLLVKSFDYTIFDLGLVYRLMFLFHSYHLVIWYGTDIVFSPNPFSKLIFIPLSFFMYINNSIFMPLILQIVIISISGYAIFYIARIKLSNTTVAIILEVAYFLYPATYGFMANGANYMCYLESFILIGYLFYIKKQYIFAFIFFLFASIANLWGPLIVMVFIFFDVLSNSRVLDLLKFNNKPRLQISRYIINILENNKRDIYLLISILITDVVIFSIVIYLIGGIMAALASSRLQLLANNPASGISSSILSNFLTGLGTVKLQFLNEVLSPFLYLPTFTLYIIPVIVYIVIIWFTNPNNSGAYEVLSQHYSYLFASFLIIGSIHFLKKIVEGTSQKKIVERLLTLILVSSLISFALYSPFSLNNFQNGQISKSVNISQFDRDLSYGINLIPLNSSVFIQNDLPQLMNRYNVYMPGYYHNETVDYAVIIPFGFSPISDAYSGYSQYWANHFQTNSSYGLYENIDGAYIYKLNYVGDPVYFVPLTYFIAPGVNGLEPVNSAKIQNDSIVASNITQSQILWDGGFTNYYPGNYEITFQLEASKLKINNSVTIFVIQNSGLDVSVFAQKVINSSDFSAANVPENFTVQITVDNFYSGLGIQYQASSGYWSGMLKLKAIYVQQVLS
ncbi:MAG: DUF2079 domain-containing protein [Thermoplasmatales archaeon]